MRPILAAALGFTALAITPIWLAAGCAAGNTSETSGTASTGSSGTAGTGGAGTGGKTGTGGTGGSGTGGASTGGAGTGGTNTGGSGNGGAGGMACVPSPELCDGIDNNCDGVIDENCGCKNGDTKPCYSGDPATQGIGVCHGGVTTCDLMGVFGACVGEVVPSPEVCNDQDDDCNGSKDEGLGTTTCGLGICTMTVDNCVAGIPQTCTPGPSVPEKCNGVDDNCDGVVDEGCLCEDGQQQACYTGPPSTMNVGECAPGTQICGAGQWGPCMNEVLPAAETCNAKDDDCDGTIDDGLGTSVCGVGECNVVVQNCVGGMVQTCTPGQPSSEVCDGKDNDCNGTVDDGLGTISCGIGACANTVASCKNGLPNVCNPLPAQVESCNGIDDNCNGVIDDGDPGGGAACNTGLLGVCAAGTVHCVGGSLQCVQNVQPSAEVCDGKDNDCNGAVDDNNPGGNISCATGKLGVCSAGTTLCQGGAIVCVQDVQPTAEVCDAADNNCNGGVDEGNPGGGLTCDTGKLGACQPGTTACTSGTILCNQNVPPTGEVCDGIDNNCNGQVDEGNPGGGLSCNTGMPGVCAPGTTACTSGAVVCNQNVTASGEICDGKDNDCNGQIDDGNPGGGLSCSTGKLGVCAPGTTACSNGSIACNQNVPASGEVCDGKDNDCNGLVDDGNPGGGAVCSTGLQGVCSAGTTSCTAGSIACNQNLQPTAEVCDGKDNNCNGQVDEGNPGGGAVCSTGLQGVCSAGTTSCTAGSIACNQNLQPTAEVCDGKDNNCDGQVDEGNPGGGVACSTGKLGVCAAGHTACTGGQIVCVQNVQPSAETCDGLDNDCDGQIDNGNPGGGATCNSGKLGVCAAGTTACTAGAVVCNQNVQPSAETCDGLDNNCDGQVDEGNPGGGASCNTGKLGVCAAGTTACTAGSLVCNQNLQPSAEICDGLDNNCNGSVDDGVTQACYTGPGGTSGVGVCHGGTQTCTNGTFGACVGQVVPSAETCDGLDNDCNGVVDNGNPGGGASCSTGKLGVCAAGTTACTAGAVVCNQNVQPSAETCDGLDNDCNGIVDNGNPGGGLGCNTGKLGICSAGTTACTAGAIACNQNNQPTAEVCDGLDNDCNGVVDNGNPGGGFSCSTGKPGVCAAGTTLCSSGSVVCNQNVQPSAEVCDGLDNDCNGVVDNGNPGGGVACSTGKQGVCAAGTTACTGGSLACSQSVLPSAESCNGLDDNCDGAVDNALVPDGVPTSCANAANTTVNVAVNGTANVTGYVDLNGSDWFLVNMTGVPGTGGYYHPKVTFLSNPGTQFKLQVYTSCGTTAAGCSGNLDTFEMSYPNDPNGCNFDNGGFTCSDASGKPTTFIVNVLRAAGTSGATNTCTPYTVQITDI